jgi:DNA-binding response OmpR family regulator
MAAKILLVDDNKVRRDSLQAILTLKGQFGVEAANCAGAIFLLATNKYDLILLDVTLPDKSGFRVLQTLREKHLSGKVIVITGTVEVEKEIMSSTPGAGDYIVKPYNPKYLLMSIEHVLSDQSQPGHKLQIIKAGDFIKSTPTGDLDLMASKQGFAEIAATGADLHDYTVLIDLRDVKSSLTTSQIYELAAELVTYGSTFRRKTAVLARDNKNFDQATFFETAAQNRGFRVKAFTVFEDALVWLSIITQSTEDQ